MQPETTPAQSPDSLSQTADDQSDVANDENHSLQPRQNLQLCNWRHRPGVILSESESELTISLSKNTTITFIGCFDFIVLKGAININGANFGASSLKHRAFVPSTHPISTIRGLDRNNEVRFLDCEEPPKFEHLSPLFADIWSTKIYQQNARSFILVS
jgi:polynucleotide 5'-hydroxyl-kinase GRC3/NOL9